MVYGSYSLPVPTSHGMLCVCTGDTLFCVPVTKDKLRNIQHKWRHNRNFVLRKECVCVHYEECTHRISSIDCLRSERSSGDYLLQPFTQRDHLDQVAQGHIQQGFAYLQGWKL